MGVFKILAVLTDRANLGRLQPVLEAIRDHDLLNLFVVATGTMPLERFKRPVEVVRNLGLHVEYELLCEVEGATPYAQAKSRAMAESGMADILNHAKPDAVVMIGDRHEMIGCAGACSEMLVPFLHIQGGEVSGGVDDERRDAVTRWAKWHVPATKRAKERLLHLGVNDKDILTVGCPSSDLAAGLKASPSDFILGILHSNTLHPQTAAQEAEEYIAALNALANEGRQIVLVWPNIDAGSNSIVREIRQIANHRNVDVVKYFPPEEFLQRLADCAVAVGNSSSFCRDSSFFGTPVVLVGDRQQGREHAENVTEVQCNASAIMAAVGAQLRHGRYALSTLYGDGQVSQRIAEGLSRVLSAKRAEAVA